MKASLAQLACLSLLALAAGCFQDETFSTSQGDRLTFSTDTVSFDTVISGEPTNTRTFMVYNRGAHALRIRQAYLAGGADSPFRANVDGTFLEGGTGGGFEVYGEDSIRVFLEMTAPETGSDEPVGVEDELTFVLESGLAQSVRLMAYGQDVIVMRQVVVGRDSTLDAKRPYQVMDSLVVAPGATLTLAPGTRFYFHPDASLVVHGTLLAEGTQEEEIMMRGDRMGYMFSNQPYDLIPGQWGGVVLTEGSYGNVFRHCDIHSGNFGLRCDSSGLAQEKVRVENSVIHNTMGDAFSAVACSAFVGNSQLTNAGGNCVTLVGGSYRFVHCTIANFYSFTGGDGVALSYTNTAGGTDYPLEQADFLNCLITGYSDDEIMGTASADEGVPFNFLFRNCLLGTPEADDERIQDCLWDNDEADVYRAGNFYPPFDLASLTFTFTLDSLSQARGHADIGTSREYYPTDRLGRDRVGGGAPDIGCYQYAP